MKLKELQGRLQVGDIIETDADGVEVGSYGRYKISRMLKTKFYSHPIDSGGNIMNSSEWVICFNNPDAEITVTNRLIDISSGPKTKTEEIDFKIDRDGSMIKLFLKIPEKMEEYFKGLSREKVKTSTTWLSQKEGEEQEGVDFYVLTEEYKSLEEKINNYRVFNNFGDGLVSGEKKINLAPLRIVGASKGVEIFSTNFSSLDNLELKYFVKKLAESSKEIWSNCISKKVIKGKIRFEIEI